MKLLALFLLVVTTYGVSAQKNLLARGGKGGGGTKCSTPSGLSTSGITISSATANWSPVSGANSYNVDYKQSSSSSWINIASGTTSLSWNLSGLPASTSFDWRVRTNCSSGSSGYAQKTFSTLSQISGGGDGGSCNAPTGLSTSPITASSATATWAHVSGAVSYNLDYKLASSPDWVTIANATTSLQWTIGGLVASTSYDWRVRANCTSGNSSYTQTQFTSGVAGSCSAPGGLYAAPASSTATLYWNSVSGALVYTVQYKPTSSGTWIVATSGTYGLSVNLYALSANTTYDWRVYTSCSLIEASGYSNGQFTTSGGATKAAATTTATLENANPNFTINLFPNPAGDQLNVWVEGIQKRADIKVYDLMGKLVMQQASNNTLTQLNISKLTGGFYLVKVNDGKENKSAKFVKN
jgi:hypothetical protein